MPRSVTPGTSMTPKRLRGTACCRVPQALMAAKPVTWPNRVAQHTVFVFTASEQPIGSMYYIVMFIYIYICMYVYIQYMIDASC